MLDYLLNFIVGFQLWLKVLTTMINVNIVWLINEAQHLKGIRSGTALFLLELFRESTTKLMAL